MPITINGDGSITGLAVGGLPDGCVDTDTLANSAVTGAKQGAGSVIQVVQTVKTDTYASGSLSPHTTASSNAIEVSITPTNASNKLMIDIVAQLSDDGGDRLQMALYQDSTANALASNAHYQSGGAYHANLTMKHFMTAGTTSETTFKMRAGGTGGTTTFNGEGGARKLGGTFASSITITEISV